MKCSRKPDCEVKGRVEALSSARQPGRRQGCSATAMDSSTKSKSRMRSAAASPRVRSKTRLKRTRPENQDKVTDVARPKSSAAPGSCRCQSPRSQSLQSSPAYEASRVNGWQPSKRGPYGGPAASPVGLRYQTYFWSAQGPCDTCLCSIDQRLQALDTWLRLQLHSGLVLYPSPPMEKFHGSGCFLSRAFPRPTRKFIGMFLG